MLSIICEKYQKNLIGFVSLAVDCDRGHEIYVVQADDQIFFYLDFCLSRSSPFQVWRYVGKSPGFELAKKVHVTTAGARQDFCNKQSPVHYNRATILPSPQNHPPPKSPAPKSHTEDGQTLAINWLIEELT